MAARIPPRIGLVLMLFAALTARAQERQPLVELNTPAGRMVVALFNDTPLHRDRFLALVRTHCYDSLALARVVPGFMVLSDSLPKGSNCLTDKLSGQLPAEPVTGHLHLRGALVAAALEGNDARTDGSRFFLVDGQDWTEEDLQFLNELRRSGASDQPVYTPEQIAAYVKQGGAPRLDGRYTVFGQVVEGVEVVAKLAALPAGEHDRPLTDPRLWMRELP